MIIGQVAHIKIAAWTALSRSDPHVTGVGKHIVNMLSGLSRSPGIDLEWLVPVGAANLHESASQLGGLSTAVVPLGRPVQRTLANVIGWPTARRWSHSCDWVYCPRELWIPPGRARLAITVHDLWGLDQERPRWREKIKIRWLLGKALRRADLILAVSAFTADRINANFGHLQEKIRIVGNGASPAFNAQRGYERSLVDSGLGNSRYGISVGGLTFKKGGDHFLRMAARLSVRLPDFKLVLVGPVSAEFAAQSLPSNVIHVARGLSDEQLAGLVASAEFACSLSRYEGFGITLIEAMSVGTPVIASDIPAHREIAGDGAILVAAADADGICDSIERLASDREFHGRMRACGYRQAREHTWARSVDRLGQALREFSNR
ncbi:MAG: glycosyltransferase family 4 protein [Rhodanobacteraceae bacterium]|nr:glycosyltransferase family 4 protein [Rhodanobacteraceae bacterium]